MRITLKRPDAAFLVSSLSKLNLAPKHVWQPIFDDLANKPQTAESIMEPKPVGSGPFRVASINLNEQIVLEANPDHWSKPKAARFIMRITPNIEATLGALRSGEINFLTDYTGDPQLLYRTGQVRSGHRCFRQPRHRLQVRRLQRAPAAIRRCAFPPGAVRRDRP